MIPGSVLNGSGVSIEEARESSSALVLALAERAADLRVARTDLGDLAEDPPRSGQPRQWGGTGLLRGVEPSHVIGIAIGPAKLPLFDPFFPLFKHDRPDHGLTARNADRAVLVRLRRFLAGIRAIWETLIRRAL